MRIVLSLLLLLSSFLTVHAQSFTDSNLPIVIINTDNGAYIPDEPGILATMKIIDRGQGKRNYVTDQDSLDYLNYSGRIDIELRGSASQSYPKKAFGFTTIMDDENTNNNVSLLGMPEENDWILDGLSSDSSLIRNFLSFNLSRQIGQYASRTAYCEVVINGQYNGLYILEEKIKPDKNRVNIIKIENDDNFLPELTGGYITKTDKTTGNDPVAWSMSSYIGFNDNQFIHHWPKPEHVTAAQNNYIHAVFTKLQTACTAGNESMVNGFPSMIDIPSFIDFMLINELASNVDAYTFSTFYHKDRNGKLRAGPIWDLNLTYGNDLFIWGFDRSKPDVWQFSNGSLEGPKYFRDLFNNADFKCYLSRRWNELKQQGRPFNLNYLDHFIDSTAALISEAVMREEARWGTIGDHKVAVKFLKDWIHLRVPWMTNHLGSSNICEDVTIPPLVLTRINYHPGTSVTFPEEDDLEFLEITNTGTYDINLTGIYFGSTGLTYQFPAGATLPIGETLTLASDSATFESKYGKAPFGAYTRQLSNADQDLLLLDAFGNEIDHVHYYDSLPWPDADGNGLFLQLINDTLDNNLASSWEATDGNTVNTDLTDHDFPVLVYPNPTTGKLRISTGQLIHTVDIFDLQGRTLLTFSGHEKEVEIDISQLTAGMYFTRIMMTNGFRVKKILRK